MRAGYLLMGVGLALVKWPLLPEAHTLPLYEGVTLCLLTAMSLLAFLGLRYPVTLLPVLLFESAWKLLWLPLVALPTAVTGALDAATTGVAVNCSLVLVILAVIPWGHVWRSTVAHRNVRPRAQATGGADATGLRRRGAASGRVMRSPGRPKMLRISAGSSPVLPNQCGTWVSNSATSPGPSTQSSSPSTSRRWPDRT